MYHYIMYICYYYILYFSGKICFWDGNKGTNIANYQALKSNALILCLDESQTKVYCSG